MSKNIDYNEAIEIAEGVYWVGFPDMQAGFHCNAYLVVDGDEAVVIDSGGRNDFSTVMLKIMRTGTNPRNIKRLIYQHYDPDLCGNIPQMEAVINNPELRIISHYLNNIYIKYYSVKSPIQRIDELEYNFEFSSGRRLRFIPVPYCHAPGSFISYDEKTKTLFSGDIFGAYDNNWTFYSEITNNCLECDAINGCEKTEGKCQWNGMLEFHRQFMPSLSALKSALEEIDKLDVSVLAPQHGSVHKNKMSREVVQKRLSELDCVGFDYFYEKEYS